MYLGGVTGAGASADRIYRTVVHEAGHLPRHAAGHPRHRMPTIGQASNRLTSGPFSSQGVTMLDASRIARGALRLAPFAGIGVSLVGNLQEDQSVGRSALETGVEAAYGGVISVGVGFGCAVTAGIGCAAFVAGGAAIVGLTSNIVGEVGANIIEGTGRKIADWFS